MAEKFFEYKGKPLVRSGNTVYYGDINDPYVVCLTIKNSEDYKDITLAGDITIQLLATDETLIIRPLLFLKYGRADLQIKNVPKKFVSKIFLASCSLVFSIEPEIPIPALFITKSNVFSFSTISFIAFWQSSNFETSQTM